jgi:DNA-binding protein YbaB
VVDLDDLEMLEDLLVTAFNDAVEKATNLAAERMNAVTGGLPIPGLDGLF